MDRRRLPEPLLRSEAAEEAEGVEGALRKAFAAVLGRDVTEAHGFKELEMCLKDLVYHI